MLLYVGRYTEVKRIPLLIRAYARAQRALRAARAPLVLLGGYPGECEGEHPIEVIRETGRRATCSWPAGAGTRTCPTA